MTKKIISKFIKHNGEVLEIFSSGDVYNVSKRRMLKQYRQSDGYRSVYVNGKNCYVHRLIAFAFLGYSDKETVNHIDGDKTNNNIDNIEYATKSKNMLHAWQTGLQPRRRKWGKVYKNMSICQLCVACYGYDGGFAYNKIKKLLKNKDYKTIDNLLKKRAGVE